MWFDYVFVFHAGTQHHPVGGDVRVRDVMVDYDVKYMLLWG